MKALLLLALCLGAHGAPAVEAGGLVWLRAEKTAGVPLHPAPGKNAVSGRLPDGADAVVVDVDPATGWILVDHYGTRGWIIRKYIGTAAPPPAPVSAPQPAPPPPVGTPLSAKDEYRIGTWNLEHFGKNKSRGFPENTRGGPTYPPRTRADLERLAEIIRSLEFRILVLSEIDARPAALRGENRYRSDALDDLVHALGESYTYAVGASGDGQHLAMLYDTRHVRLNALCECDFEEREVDDQSLFDRQPLVAHFTLLHNGALQNDLVVAGVHLASGQDKTSNHDEAMRLLQAELTFKRGISPCIPRDETDVVIMGDFNASRFDTRREGLWDDLERSGWDVLADTPDYPATRLSGVPLGLRDSKIDYIVVSASPSGLQGEEVRANTALVHTELIQGDPETFRAYASDHLPVSIPVKVTDDRDRATP